MDWGYKAALTAVTVALVLLVARTVGRRLAGVLAGLPVITAPALLWVATEHGTAFAARTAVGSIAACGLMAVFALAYERVARRHGPGLALSASVAAMALAALPMALVAGHPLRATAITAALCAAAVRFLPSGGNRAGQARKLPGEIALTAAAAGLVSAFAAFAARELGAYWAGLFAALPIISGAALVNQHLRATHADIQRFLRGYVAGLLGKALFALAFGATVTHIGAPLAVAGSLIVGIGASLALTRGLSWIERRPLAAATRTA